MQSEYVRLAIIRQRQYRHSGVNVTDEASIANYSIIASYIPGHKTKLTMVMGKGYGSSFPGRHIPSAMRSQAVPRAQTRDFLEYRVLRMS